eukprot:5292353-Pleurochrysis_carterae.AAC.1
MRPDVASERARRRSACLGRATRPSGRRADVRAHPGTLHAYVVRVLAARVVRLAYDTTLLYGSRRLSPI